MIDSILITGGGSGIGAAVAKALAGRGCHVLISGRRAKELEAIAEGSSSIVALPADVTDPSGRAALVGALADLPGRRAIFHGAGYFQLGQLDTLSSTDWQRSFDTNVTARWALTAGAVDCLKGGRVLFIGSDSGANPRVGGAAYSVAQSASETLRRALQAEWADRDIAVAGFKPGLVDTDLVQGFLSKSEEEFPAKGAFQGYLDRGEFATPDTVAAFAAWLLLELPASRFSETEWDIRDASHHSEWLGRPLYS